MPELTLKVLPDSTLRRKAGKVARVTDAERGMLADMAKTMYLAQGVGLAAVQVGIDRSLAVVDVGEGIIKMVNPVIVKKEGRETAEEGCLSVPGVSVKVRRAKRIVVGFMNEEGDAMELMAEGLLARAIQHEIDHLAGRLIIDHLNPIKRLFLARRGRRPLTK